MGTHEIKLGELCENSSREVTQKIYSGKKIKARLCDFRPSFLRGYKGTAGSYDLYMGKLKTLVLSFFS